MQLEPDTERLLRVRKAQGMALARQRYATHAEVSTGGRGLSYALLIIMLFQTILLSCAIFSFGGLLLLNLSYLFYRPPFETYAAASIGRTPSPVAALAPTSTPPETVAPIAPPAPATPLPATAAPPPPLPTETPAASMMNSPIATVLPTPTFTPVNNVPAPAPGSPEIQNYANQVLPPLNNLVGVLQGLHALAQNPNVNDGQWVANVNAQMTSFQASQEQLSKVQPPPEAQEIHNAFLNVLNTCRMATDAINASIINHNPSTLTAAMPAIESCNTQFPGAANNLREWLRVRTGTS